MSYYKELNFGYSKLNPQLCRKGFIWMLIILGVILSGCEGGSTPVENNDEYYVKYIVKSRSIYSASITARIKSENNSNIEFTIKKGTGR